MANENICRHCGKAILGSPYFGDTNPDHIRALADAKAPSLDLLHNEGRIYDTFCSKEHYVRWIEQEKKRLPPHRHGGEDEAHSGDESSL